MNIYRFARFRFDSRRLELFDRGQPVALRHKTAALLRALLESRGQVIGKRRLANQVWHSEHVRDQSVFQAVSELRRKLEPLQPIKTHPNLGYEWVTPLRSGLPHWRIALAAAAACIALTAGLLGGVTNLNTPDPHTDPALAGLSPALQAFANGLAALDAGHADTAARHFELAMRENPGFDAARLLLSEALLARGEYVQARAQATALVATTTPGQDPYISMAAMALLSRSDQQSGHTAAALDWAVAAADQARAAGFACAAAELDTRIVELLRPQPEAAASADLATPAQSPVTLTLAQLNTADAPDYCARMRPGQRETGAVREAPETPFEFPAYDCIGVVKQRFVVV